MFQRLLLAFSLIVSFGVAQIGAVTHDISHFGVAKTQNQSINKNSAHNSQNEITPDNQAPHNQVCEKCISYAELGHAVQNSDLVLPAKVTTQLYLNSSFTSSSYLKLRSYSARAPPNFA